MQTRSLTFASQVDRPLVNNLLPLGYIKTIKLINGWIAVGGHEFQHRSKLWAVAIVWADEFTVFVAKPFVSQIGKSRGDDKWYAPMLIQGLKSGIHRNKIWMVDTDDGGQQGQGRLEIREAGGIIFASDVQIFGIHYGVGSDLQFGELGNLDVDIISACPGAAEDRTGPLFFFQIAKQIGCPLDAFQRGLLFQSFLSGCFSTIFPFS